MPHSTKKRPPRRQRTTAIAASGSVWNARKVVAEEAAGRWAPREFQDGNGFCLHVQRDLFGDEFARMR